MLAVFAEDAADEDADLGLGAFAQRSVNRHAFGDLRDQLPGDGFQRRLAENFYGAVVHFQRVVAFFCNNSTARLRCGKCWTSARNSSDKIEMSGFFNPAASKMSMTLSEEMARETICRTTKSNFSGAFQSACTTKKLS